MAIQLPNPGLGDGQTGDNEFVMWTKVKDNFNNSTHAASRLVGTGASDVMQVGAFGLGAVSFAESIELTTKTSKAGFYKTEKNSVSIYLPWSGQWAGTRYAWGLQVNSKDLTVTEWTDGKPTKETKVYTTENTTKDVATGFLKASSPVLHVYNDKITKIHEAEQLDIKVDKKGVGHYEIHGTTGLRKNDGWFMSPPRDMHSNVLCMVDYEEKDGVIILKTYKKKFDFETVSIVHDYDNPMDIPEGSCVEFRFNDLPEELTNEPIE